ncbi:hypothetical protein TD95_002366 [Thielaviopsis punctulata]|uniref:Peptidase A1 domain-containing protein n=1 Tax=Thielaviopsis punctulata TaxID=72032 RepID=A0A0F4ZC39_9PEZI|nr:hypothetical protein TD95_002366 [Thielaviopsis punctulata]
MKSAFISLAAFTASSLVAAKTTARLLTGSSWLGIDGNWSASAFRAVDQDVHLFVSTTLSEHWVIETGGCGSDDPLCVKDRGGTVKVAASSTWSPLGNWSIGLSYLNVTANADYGTASFGLTDSLSGTALDMKGALIGALNTTGFFVGLFGLGFTSGRFGSKTFTSPFVQSVETDAWFPSYSYGYTAGAYYKNMPSSLTLGGYDAGRIPSSTKNVDFTLSRDTMIPRVLVRGIQATTRSGSVPANWDAASLVLTNYSSSFLAIIDSSTSYLWLPGQLVDNFVAAMNLTYNATLDAYLLTDSQLAALKADDAFQFTFSLSSYDNTNDFGHPLAVDGVVNITLTGAAFAHLLQYPYGNGAIADSQPAVPHFPIKKATGTNFVLGRVFLQEAYILTRYDYSSFQLHQAAFPADPLAARDVRTLTQPLNSAYPKPGSMKKSRRKLGAGAVAGISVGGTVGVGLVGCAVWWYLRRRRRRNKTAKMEKRVKEGAGKMDTRALSAEPERQEEQQSVVEQENQQFELPGNSTAVVEMEAGHGGHTRLAVDGYNGLSADGYTNLTPYQLSQHQMDLSLRGPVPPYTPGTHPTPIEKPSATLSTPQTDLWTTTVSALTDGTSSLGMTKQPLGTLDPALGPARDDALAVPGLDVSADGARHVSAGTLGSNFAEMQDHDVSALTEELSVLGGRHDVSALDGVGALDSQADADHAEAGTGRV